ncbi:MAG: hypothetical protein KAX58_07210 [Aeromonadaceae bacterium]|nr:hypothetical protein [Aeromonadaceae bacterium]
MLPRLLYESLPLFYLLAGLLFLVVTKQPLLLFAGLLLYTCGTLIWVMRSGNRRTDNTRYANKRNMTPEWLYEIQPFIQIGLVLLMWRQPLALWLQLLSLPLVAWALICLQRRSQFRHHKMPH